MPTSAQAAERHLLITLHCQPAHRPHVQPLLLELVELVRREPGCLYYNLFEQADAPDTFLLAAAWADEAAVAAHPTPAQTQLVDRMRPLLAAPMQVIALRQVSEPPAGGRLTAGPTPIQPAVPPA